MSLFTNQSSVCTCLKITNYEQFRTKCCKLATAKTITTELKGDNFLSQICFDKTKMLHQKGNVNVLRPSVNKDVTYVVNYLPHCNYFMSFTTLSIY